MTEQPRNYTPADRIPSAAAKVDKFYAAADEGIGHMIGTVGGAWQLASKMAEGLGDAVIVNAPVRSIAQTRKEHIDTEGPEESVG